MKWSEIKKAVEQAGIEEEDEIIEIHCHLHDGGKSLEKISLGNYLVLNEAISEEARNEASGCAI